MSDATAPRSSRIPRVLLVAGRVFLGAVFVYAAYTKFHPAGHWELRGYWILFAMSIDSYHALPAWGVVWLARVLPWAELGLGALLIAGLWQRYVAAAASVLLIGFFSAMLRAHFKGLEIDCGCFGPGEKLGARTLIRDGLLLGLSLALTAGALLIAGLWQRYVAAAASVLLIGFFSAMLRAHFKGLEIDCGCFGPGEKLGARTLIRDGLLLGLSLALTAGAFLTRRVRDLAN